MSNPIEASADALLKVLLGATDLAREMRQLNADTWSAQLSPVSSAHQFTGRFTLRNGRLSLKVQLLPDEEDGREEDDEGAAPRGGEAGTLH